MWQRLRLDNSENEGKRSPNHEGFIYYIEIITRDILAQRTWDWTKEV